MKAWARVLAPPLSEPAFKIYKDLYYYGNIRSTMQYEVIIGQLVGIQALVACILPVLSKKTFEHK